MSRRLLSSSTRTTEKDEDDVYQLLYDTARLLGNNPKSLSSLRKGHGGLANQTRIVFIPAILQTCTTPTTLKIANIHIGDKVTTLKMVPKWFQPNDRTEILKDMECPDDVKDKHSYETIACYRAAIGKGTNFRREPLDVGERSTETLILSLDAFAKQFGGELNFTNYDLSFDDSAEQMATGIANLGSAHLLATDSMPTAIFNFKISLDYKRDLARTSDTMENFIVNFSTGIAQTLNCQKDSVRVFSVEKSSEVGTSSVKFGLTNPNLDETKRLANNLQVDYFHIASLFSCCFFL